MSKYVLLGVVTFWIVLVTARPALAHNCGSLSDCYGAAQAAVIAAAALSTLVAVLLSLPAVTRQGQSQEQEDIPWWQSPFKHAGGFFVGIGKSLWESVIGLKNLGVYASEWITDPGNNGQRLHDLQAGLAQLMTREGLQAVWDGLKEPYKEAWGRGAYGEAIGRGVGALGELLIGSKGISGLSRTARAADIADSLGSTARVANTSSDVASGIPNSLSQEIRAIPKGQRPNPNEYLSTEYIQNHLSQFENGGSYLVPKDILDNYGRDNLGFPDSSQFVMPKFQMDEILKNANGDIAFVERELGIPEGTWQGKDIVQITIPNPNELNLRIPSGNEMGANTLWLPGGKLPTGYSEAVIDNIPTGKYVEEDVLK